MLPASLSIHFRNGGDSTTVRRERIALFSAPHKSDHNQCGDVPVGLCVSTAMASCQKAAQEPDLLASKPCVWHPVVLTYGTFVSFGAHPQHLNVVVPHTGGRIVWEF